MASQEDEAGAAPLLRPAIPGNPRNQSGSRTPRLGLAIPPSPKVRPINGDSEVPPHDPAPKPQPPTLQLATPMGSNTSVPETNPAPRERGLTLRIATPNSSEATPHSRSGSSGELPANQNNLATFRNLLQNEDPASAVSSHHSGGADGGVAMEREQSTGILPDLERLSLERGRPLDVEDLDDAGWKVAARDNKIEELGTLGEGSGGAVTRCRLRGGQKVFALKIITADPNPDVRRQIVRELSFNKKMSHEHICGYYGAFINDSTGTISIVMEYCEGGSLYEIYKEVKDRGGRTGEKVFGRVAEGVLNGLTYLHEHHRIIHRDIKPSNILLCRDGTVKLCDFGVSGESGTQGDATTFIGTSYYMAPERIQGQLYTITSDVWSLGVTLLEVAQHRFPFPADGTEIQPRAGIFDLLNYIVRQPIPKLKDEPEKKVKWSPHFKYFIECCLEKDGKKRALPWQIVKHPWIVDMQKKNVDMSRFLRDVWAWPE